MSILLITHIIIAITLTGSTLALALAGYRRNKAERALAVSTASFIGTLVSGLLLIVVLNASLTHFCATMTVFALATFAARKYYQVRSVHSFSTDEN